MRPSVFSVSSVSSVLKIPGIGSFNTEFAETTELIGLWFHLSAFQRFSFFFVPTLRSI